VQPELAALDPSLRLRAGAIAQLPTAGERDVDQVVERLDRSRAARAIVERILLHAASVISGRALGLRRTRKPRTMHVA
jgi:hypothetical protein